LEPPPPNIDLTLLKPLLMPCALIVPNFLKKPLPSSFLGADGRDSASAATLTLGLLVVATAGFIVMDTASRNRGDGERPA
jgi:hypothetical protein